MTDTLDYMGAGVLTERLVAPVKPDFVSQGKRVVDGVTLTCDPTLCEVTVGEEADNDHAVGSDLTVYTVELTLKKGTDPLC